MCMLPSTNSKPLHLPLLFETRYPDHCVQQGCNNQQTRPRSQRDVHSGNRAIVLPDVLVDKIDDIPRPCKKSEEGD